MSARMDRCASRMQPVWTCLEATAASVNLDIASPPLDSVWVSLRLWSAMAFKEVKGVSSTQIIQYIIGVVNGCHCSLNQQGFSQLLMTSVEIIQNWWKHGAGLEKRLEEAAKKLLSSLRMKLTSLCLLVAWCCLASWSYCIKLSHMKLFELHILAKDKAPEAAQWQSGWGGILHGGLLLPAFHVTPNN